MCYICFLVNSIFSLETTSPTPDMDQVEASFYPISISMINIRLIAERFKDKVVIATHTRYRLAKEGRPHQLMDLNIGPPTQHPPQRVNGEISRVRRFVGRRLRVSVPYITYSDVGHDWFVKLDGAFAGGGGGGSRRVSWM